MSTNELIDEFTRMRTEIVGLEKQVAQLTVENGRWRELAVSALRAWEIGTDLQLVMAQIKEGSQR